MTQKEFKSMQKEILMNMRFMDSTIKGITETPEYKENCAYNKGISDTLSIVKKYYNNEIN